MSKQPEVLAPAGNLSCLKAAVAAGADAVYFGGQAFNARRGAGNFSVEDIQEAVTICRMRGVKTNLTLNTLVKQKEWSLLTEYIDQVLPLGIDAVIVQDLGVAEMVRQRYPQVALHASTQMAVQDLDGVLFLKQLGFKRVVLAREVTLEEIRQIRQKTDMELEVFVHGALCYSYSGRCLMSSFHGGRSGNRGACAQPCRLSYQAEKQDGYWMNLKDLCAAPHMEALLKAGVDSFKIEGRLKGEAYVAGVTQYYHQLVTQYLQNGKLPEVKEEQLRPLKQLFNRGGFTDGYYQNKERMIEKNTPKHQGIQIGSIIRVNKGRIQIESSEILHSGDELEIRAGHAPYPAIRLSASMLRGEQKAEFYLKGEFRPGQTVWRVVDPVLQKKILEEVKELPQVPLAMTLCVQIGRPAKLSAMGHTVLGETVLKAETRGLTEETVRKQLCKTGGSGYEVTELTTELEEGSYLSAAALNQLRRSLLEELKQVERCQRENEIKPVLQYQTMHDSEGIYQIGVDHPEQWEVLRSMDHSRINVLLPRMEGFEKADKAAFLRLAEGKTVVPSLPPVGRLSHTAWTEKEIREWQKLGVQDFEAHLMGQAALIKRLGARVWAGPGLAVMNREAAGFWQQHAQNFMISQELTKREARELENLTGACYILYGRVRYMVTEQCIYKEVNGCQKHTQGHVTGLQDRKGEHMTVRSHCGLCYSEILSEIPIYISEARKIAALPRLELTMETDWEVRELWQAVLEKRMPDFPLQLGHWEKGVE